MSYPPAVDPRELQARLEGLRPGLEMLALPACILDGAGTYRFINAAYEAYSGHAAAEFIGRTPDEVFERRPEDDRRAQMRRALDGETVIFNRRNLEGPHAGRWVRAHYLPLRGSSGVMGVMVVLIDIEDDQRMREALQRQEAQLRHFAENIPSAIAVVDADFRFVFANKAFQEIRGLPLRELAGRKVRDVIGEAIAVEYFDPFVERLERGESCAYERLVDMPGGARRWHLVRLAPIMGADGAFGGYYIVNSDIHDIKLAQQRERERDARLRLYTDNIPDAVAYLDRDRRILFANRHFAAQRHASAEQVVGHTTVELMGPQVAAWIAERTQKVFDRGEVATYEREMRLPDGTVRWLHVTAVPDVDEGVVRGMYVVAHDITQVKEAQARLAAREEELRFFAENIPEAIVFVDLERGCTFVNNVFLATRGLTREYALGKFPAQVYPPEVMAQLQPHIDRAIAGEESSYERLLRLPSGAQHWVRVRITPRRDAGGRVVGFYVVSTDIHDLKTAHADIEDKERQLRQVIDSIPTPMVYCDAGTRYRYVNHAFLGLVGLPAEQVIGRTTREVLGEERWRALEPILRRVRAGESVSTERLLGFADGHSRWMFVRLTPRQDEHGRFLGFYATTSDIHEQKVVEQELRRANAILSAHFDNTPLAVIEWDTQLAIVRWSGQAEAIFGWAGCDMLGRSLDGWRHVYEDDQPAAREMVRGLVEGRKTNATVLMRNYRKDGSVIWVEWHSSAMHDEAGKVISILSLAQDVSSRIQAEERLQFMATHDGLTGLPNSVLLNDRLESALARARRSRNRVGVMFLDLDHFKDVNDSLGHRVGDALLKELARRIRAALRQSDLLARISGDEFVLVLEDVTDDYAPDHVARKILEEVRRPFHLEGNEIHVSCSLGLALHPEDGADAETLLKHADAAMYHAKELGRNGFRSFSAELGQRRAQRLQLESALRRALKGDELVLHYQPIMDVATGRIERAEALLRWRDPERGLVLPNAFIPLAEETGLGHAVGSWVLEKACRQARDWRDRGVGNITICVNLSAGQLRDTAMVGDLKRLLEATGCEPGWLQFEITETSMVRDVEGASLVLTRLRSLGVRIAIDDFGTGFSSLSHLRHLPVDLLKVDKSFVADIDSRGRDAARDVAGGAAIVSAVIGLARGLGLDVVAEGVEKESQLEFLRAQGCNSAQGYLICKPLPAAEFEAWLAARNAPAKRSEPSPRRPRGPQKIKIAKKAAVDPSA
ncbi:MAG TPA: PAS domain S-box protein [Usitatibacter sp.]|nr:PAS domain S-box protein [Usitatibacter sp.]